MGTNPIYQGHFLAPHWAARHKQMLGWLDAGKHVLDVVSDGTFRLAPVNGASDGLKALRVRRFAQGDQWFWIEYRQPIGFDAEVALVSPQAFTGLLIRYEDPAQPTLPESTALLDFTADSTPHVFTDPALASGKSWTDPHGSLAVQVFGADSTGISVNVRVTPPCVAASGSTLTHSYLAQTAVLPFTAPPDCSWSAQSGASWITIVGTSSGTGSGSITYRLEANDAPNAAARSGAIYVGGQVFTVTQDRLNLAPAVLPATLPASALYERTQVLEFGFTDPNGVADLREIEVLFNTSPDLRGGCGISYNVVANSLRISGPDAQWSASIAVGSMETLVTSLCSLDVAKSSVRSSGSNLVLTLALSFRDGLGPSAGVYLSVTDSGGLSSGWQRAGALALRADTKTVAAAPVLGPGTGAEKTFVFRFSDPRGPDDLNMLFFYFYGASDPRSCVLNIFPFAGRYVSLADDASGSFINPAVTGTSGTQQNALCAIDVSKMTIDTASNVASVTLPMLFSAGFNGTIRAYGRAIDKGGGDATGESVNWNVSASRCVRAVTPGALQVGAQSGANTLQVDAEAGCPWIFTSEDSWASLSSPSPRFSGSQKIVVSIAANTTATPRTTLLYLGGQPVRVIQDGAAGAVQPRIAQKGVVHGAAFNRWIASSGWVSILGEDLSPVTRTWKESDFVGNRLPVSLDGVSVKINGSPAYVSYISPRQINVLAPENLIDGKVKVEVTPPAGTSTSAEVRMAPVAPGFFNFSPDGGRYIAAVHPDGTYVGKPGLYEGVAMRPAKPGDTILLFATGLGATSPSALPGTLPSGPLPLSAPVTAWLGGLSGTILWAGLISPGLYQLNFVVPAVPDGDHLIQIKTGGVWSQTFAFLTVQKVKPAN